MGERAIAYAQSIRQDILFRKGARAWTKEKCFAVLAIWLEEEQRQPLWRDCTPKRGLPSREVIKNLFKGGLTGFLRAYAQQGGVLPKRQASFIPPEVWPAERIFAAMHKFISTYGHKPALSDMCGAFGLPNPQTMRKKFGGFESFYVAYGDAGYEVPLKRKAIRHRDQPKRDLSKPGAEEDLSITRPCLRCGKVWTSPDRKNCWICTNCHYYIDFEEPNLDGSWMTGAIVTKKEAVHWNDLELSLTPAEEMTLDKVKREASWRKRKQTLARRKMVKSLAEEVANDAEVRHVG